MNQNNKVTTISKIIEDNVYSKYYYNSNGTNITIAGFDKNNNIILFYEKKIQDDLNRTIEYFCYNKGKLLSEYYKYIDDTDLKSQVIVETKPSKIPNIRLDKYQYDSNNNLIRIDSFILIENKYYLVTEHIKYYKQNLLIKEELYKLFDLKILLNDYKYINIYHHIYNIDPDYEVSYEYDNKDRLTKIINDNDVTLIEYGINKYGEYKKIIHSNGTTDIFVEDQNGNNIYADINSKIVITTYNEAGIITGYEVNGRKSDVQIFKII